MAKRKIYTAAYRPFLFGSPHTPISIEVSLGRPKKYKHGVQLHVVNLPGVDRTLIVEHESGGIVGNDLDQVVKDLEATDRKTVRKQIADAIEEGKRATPYSLAEFAAAYNQAKDR